MEVSVDTSQIQILEDFFEDLSHADQRKIFMAAYRKAARPLVAAIKANTPVLKKPSAGRTMRTTSAEPGALRKSIGTLEFPANISILVGPTFSGISKNLRYLGAWVEAGTKARYRKQRRKIRRGYFKGQYKGVTGGTGYTGIMPPNDFIERAYNATEDQVFGTIEKSWYDEIDNFIVRVNRKLKK